MHTINFPLNMILRGDFDFEIKIFEFLVLWFHLHFQLHVDNKPHFAMFSFTFSIPRLVTCFLSITKNCTQFQFLTKAHYMFPQYDKKPHFTMLSFSFSVPRPITYIPWLANSSIHSNLPCRDHTSNSCGRVLLKGM